MFPRPMIFAFTCLAMTGVSAADDLPPGAGLSIHVAGYEGVVFYTVEQDGYKVVATLALGADGIPVRLTSTLAPGQRIVISVPQSVDRPSVDVEIRRDADAIVVSDPMAGPISDTNVDLVGLLPAPAAASK